MDGLELVIAERKRQVEELGYTPEHDLEHDDHDLAFAAACYAAPAPIFLIRQSDHPDPKPHGSVQWVQPWPNEWDPMKRSDRLDELVKAGALIVAEIDRLLAQEPESDV